MLEASKRCGRCKDWKAKELFGKNKKTKDGMSCYCKPCTKVIGASWYINNTEKSKSASRSYKRLRHWSVALMETSSSSAKSRGLEHSITVDHLIALWDNQEGNVVIASTFANLGRSETSIEEFKEFLVVLNERYDSKLAAAYESNK